MPTLMSEMNNKISMLIGRKIRNVRKEKGISGAQLGKMLQISQQQISRYERGINQISIDSLYEISVALDVSIFLLLVLEQEDTYTPILNIKQYETYLG